MKLKWILLLFAVNTLLLTKTLQAQWSTAGSAGFNTGGGAAYTSLVFDSNDTPYVAFQDGSKATVMKYNGSSWDSVGNTRFSAGYALYTSLAFDSNDTPYVAYLDGAWSDEATVMKYNGSSWVAVGGGGFSPGKAYYTSLAFDSNDNPYIAFQDYANSRRISVMKYNGSSWAVVGTAGFSAGRALYTSLAFDSNDTPYVAFQNIDNSDKVSVLKYNGSAWDSVGNTGFSAGAAYYLSSLVFDSNDNPYVAYADGGQGSKATVMKYNGSSWTAVGSAGFSAGSVVGISLAFDSKDNPYVAYRDNGNNATVMKYNGSSWDSVGNTSFSAGDANHISLAFDSNDDPYISFRDGNSASKLTVMYYETPSTWNGSTWSKGTPDSTSKAEIASDTAPGSFSCKDLTISSGYALNTGTGNTITIYGDLTNGGNGVMGSGTLTFTKNGSAAISGDTVEIAGSVIIESGCTLTTNSLLRLTSDASNTGRIGNSAGTISGNVYVQCYMPGKRCFRFYGHPFNSSIALSQLTDEIDITGNGGSTNGFTITATNNPSAFWFDVTAADTSITGTNPGWTAFTSATSADWDQYELLRLLVRGAKGEGLTGGSYTPGAATFEATGTVNQGTQVITLTKGSNSTFVGCGNPFPSPIQMNTVAKGSNVGANYYAWDATSGVSGAYVTNAWTLDYKLPAYSAFFTTVSANSNNTLTFEEQDKESTGAGLFKTTGPSDWVELYIYDSTTKWDRLLIHLDDSAMEVEDTLDGKKLYNPGLDFFTRSKDGVRLAVDVRPYDDGKSIPLGLTAYNRYNKYAIKTGMFNIPAGTKLYLHDKYLNRTEELKTGFEYWFDVTNDTASQGNNRFEINMVGKPKGVITTKHAQPLMQLIPNPAYREVKVLFKVFEEEAIIRVISISGNVIFSSNIVEGTGSVTIPLNNIPNGMYIVELKGGNASFSEKLIKQ